MKKSKVIIPAAALLLISTAATVTGTVAWFTANRAVTITANQFEITNLDGNLSANLTAGQGTSVDNTVDPKVAKMNEGYKLTHGSYDATTDKAYKPVATDDGSQPTKFTELGASAWADTRTTNVFYAASFTIDFKYSYGANTNQQYLLFDPVSSASYAVVEGQSGSFTKNTYKGFRMAFYTSSAYLVWAPFYEDATASGNLNHVSGAEATSAYPVEKITYNHSVAEQRLADGSSVSSSKYNLGAIPTAAAESLTVKVVAWYEGCDANIVNESEMDIVATALTFYCRSTVAEA